MIRLFTAVPIPDQFKVFLHEMGRGLPGAKPVAPEQMHITLRFIGEVEGGLFKDIREELAAVECCAFPLAIRGVGHFPPRGRPRVVWAGLEPTEELKRLKRKIDTRLISCGLPPDNRKFAPHITLARLNTTSLGRITSFLAGNAFVEFDEFMVDSFHLYSSKLSAKGAQHFLEGNYPLSAR